MRLCAAFLGVAALGDVWDVVSTLAGWNDEPYAIIAIHCVLFVIASAAAIGLWRARRWSIGAVVLWGVSCAVFIVALGPLLALDSAARSGLWVGAATVLIIALVIAAYARHHVNGAVASEAGSPSP
jgi:peptidoglycan/LPS O-acetylase OafA/YrhL